MLAGVGFCSFLYGFIYGCVGFYVVWCLDYFGFFMYWIGSGGCGYVGLCLLCYWLWSVGVGWLWFGGGSYLG